MTTREFPKRFDFREAESRIYQAWVDASAFRTAYDVDGKLTDPERKDAEPFVIVIPPPNVTGRLHLGHALNNSIQDLMIRYKRLDGYDALWIPGTDHAGIATQNVVTKHLDAEGVDIRELGREKFIERVWSWKAEYGDAIIEQLRRMGCSCDWSRTRFTMDERLSLAVRESFVRLFDEGLIYRGKRIVNWCPVDRTALSDDEVDKEDEKGKMYYIRYPFAENESQHVVVATTRPETLFGDVAVAVHRSNEKLSQYIGQNLRLPLQNRIIPIIADHHADPEKGTGAVKITPAHDPNDYEVGLRHNLEQINVMHENASMNDVVPEKYRGLDRYKCRRLALEDLEAEGLIEKVEDHTLAIGRSYRSKVPIEFRLSDQWFVKMEPLAARALEASGYVKQDDTWIKGPGSSALAIHPDRMEKVYYHWLSNIRDWCISRQIWWGHRIPAWFHKETGEIIVSRDTPDQVKSAPDEWAQDEDVLDTWFSSWLWPMSTLGWPENTSDLARYYPTSVLSTAKDILFFWVARMNFAGLTFLEKLPYKDVYIHSTIADKKGVTMSKSKGNGFDPMSVIDGATVEELKAPVLAARPTNMKAMIKDIERDHPQGFDAVGADALRWTLINSITEGQHVRLALRLFTDGRNFITKLWNGAGRVVQALEAEVERGTNAAGFADLADEDRWLLARLDTTIREVRGYFDDFQFGHAAGRIYHFVWDDFCAWSLELSKTRLTSDDDAVRRGALRVMGSVLADLLRLIHPITPYITEELWSRVVPAMNALDLWLDVKPVSQLLARDTYPKPRQEPQPDIEARFEILKRFVVAARTMRAETCIKDNVRIKTSVKALSPHTQPMLEQGKAAVSFLAKLEEIEFVDSKAKGMAAHLDEAFELYIDLGQYIDLKVEIERQTKVIDNKKKVLAADTKKLQNENFVSRAPADKVQEIRDRVERTTTELEKLEATRAELQSAAD